MNIYESALQDLTIGPAATMKFMSDMANESWRGELIAIFRVTTDPGAFPESPCRCDLLYACAELASTRSWSNLSLYHTYRSLVNQRMDELVQDR